MIEKNKKVKVIKSSLYDGIEVFNFLQSIGYGEFGFFMNPPNNINEFKSLLQEFDDDEDNYYKNKENGQFIYWLSVNNILVGIIKIRPRLDNALLIQGGHISYSIAPSFRGKGYGTLILNEGIKILSKYNVKKVLVTVNEENLISRKVIEKNCGKLQDIFNKHCRYWIEK